MANGYGNLNFMVHNSTRKYNPSILLNLFEINNNGSILYTD